MNIDQFFKDLDGLFNKGTSPEDIEAFLVKSLNEAKDEPDYGAYASIGNEMIGFYRSVSEFEKCFNICEDTLMLLEELDLAESEHFATTLLNVATAYRQAGRLEDSLGYYARALQIYERLLDPGDYRFSGLYNNISILLEKLNDNEKAEAFSAKALELIDALDDHEAEKAGARVNLALLKIKQDDLEKGEALLNEALELYEKINGEITDEHYSAALAGLAELSYKKGDREKALSLYEKAADEVKSHYGMSDSYKMLKANAEMIRNEIG